MMKYYGSLLQSTALPPTVEEIAIEVPQICLTAGAPKALMPAALKPTDSLIAPKAGPQVPVPNQALQLTAFQQSHTDPRGLQAALSDAPTHEPVERERTMTVFAAADIPRRSRNMPVGYRLTTIIGGTMLHQLLAAMGGPCA
jgi:hypothetical protein